jgi:hypothetical protein
VVYRAALPFASASFVLSHLFRIEPSVERGLAVALGLVMMRGIRGRAEGW